MAQALAQARDARLQILEVILAALPAPRADLSEFRAAHDLDQDRP